MKKILANFTIDSKFVCSNFIKHARFYSSDINASDSNANIRRLCLANPDIIGKKILSMNEKELNLKRNVVAHTIEGFSLRNLEQDKEVVNKIFKTNFNSEHGQDLQVSQDFLAYATSVNMGRNALDLILAEIKETTFSLNQSLQFLNELVPFIARHVVNSEFSMEQIQRLDSLVQSISKNISQQIIQEGDQNVDATLLSNIKNAILIANSKIIHAYSKIDTVAAFNEFASRFRMYGELCESSKDLLTPRFPLSYGPLMVNMMKKPHLCYLELVKLTYSLKQQMKEENNNFDISLVKEVERVVKRNQNRAKYAIGYKPELDLAHGDCTFFPNRWALQKNRKRYRKQKIIPVNVVRV